MVILFAIIAIVVLSIYILSSKDIINQIQSGQIYTTMENIIKKWFGK